MNENKDYLPIEELCVSNKQTFIYDFLRQHTLAILATANLSGQPEAAVVEFSERTDLQLIFDTYSMFRKYQNLKLNNKVALVVGWDHSATLQYEGLAKELAGEELEECRATHLQKFPDAIQYEIYAGMKYFKIVPTWIRYTDPSTFPWKRLDLHFEPGQGRTELTRSAEQAVSAVTTDENRQSP